MTAVSHPSSSPALLRFAKPIFAAFAQPAMTTKESDVAEAVWAAVHDTTGRLRFPAGADAVALAENQCGDTIRSS